MTSTTSIFAADQIEILEDFGFLQFVQIFILGDFYLMMSFLPRLIKGFDVLELVDQDEVFDNQNANEVVHGDAVKNSMLVQSMRYLPKVLAAPSIFIVGIIFIDLVILSKFTFDKLSDGNLEFAESIKSARMDQIRTISGLPEGVTYTKLNVDVRVSKSIDKNNMTLIRKIGNRISDIIGSVCLKLARLLNYEARETNYAGRYQSQERRGNVVMSANLVNLLEELDSFLRLLSRKLSDLLPSIGALFGGTVGMIFRYAFWGQLSKPFSAIVLVFSMWGRSISQFLDELRWM